MDADIVVRGRGEARALPDRARVTVVIDAEGATRDAAYADAAASARQVDAVFEGHAGALAAVTTTGLAVHPTTRWKRGETQRTGWRASRTTLVEVTGFDELGDLVAELASAGATISGPQWELDEGNPAYGEARRRAAEDARRRAEDYAAALGVALGPVTFMAEPDTRTGTETPMAFRHAMPLGAFAAGAAEDVISVSPEEMTASAAVDVGFSLSSGPA